LLAVALPEQALRAPSVARGALGAGAHGAERRLARGLAGVRRPRPCQPLAGRRQSRLDLAQLVLELARALAGGGAVADVEGQRAQLSAQGLQAGPYLALAVGERGRADRDPLLVAAQLRQHAPGLGALAVAGGEALLGGTPLLAHLVQAFLQRRPLGPGRGGGLLGGGRAIGAEAQLLGDELALQPQLLALDPRPQLRRLRLALQRAQARPRLTLEVERAIEVV